MNNTTTTNLKTNFSDLSTEAQQFLFWTICKLDISCEDIARLTDSLPDSVRQATVTLIANTLDRDDRVRILQTQTLAVKHGLNQYTFDVLNDHTRNAALSLINSAAYAISELWSLSNAGVSLDIIEQIVNQESKNLISNSPPEEIAAYFKGMDEDSQQEPEEEVQILILPYTI